MFVRKMTPSQSSLFGEIDDLQDLTFIERPIRRSLKVCIIAYNFLLPINDYILNYLFSILFIGCLPDSTVIIRHLMIQHLQWRFLYDAAGDLFRERLKQKTFTQFDVFAYFVARASTFRHYRVMHSIIFI